MTPQNGRSTAQIRIRMYRVGFGDCFLVSLPGGDAVRHILVDCGVHTRGNIDTIGKAVDDIAKETRSNLDVVIATHAHQDHISGFGTFASKFSAFHVKEVWMPWTENPLDSEAARLKKKQMALVEHLTQHFAALDEARFERARAALANLAANQAAFDLLRSGLQGAAVLYYEAGNQVKDPGGIAGLSVRFLGPPRSQEFLSKMDPPVGQRYLRLVKGRRQDSNATRPFQDHWLAARDAAGPRLNPKDREYLMDLGMSGSEALVFALDQAVNNTSLVAFMQYRGQNLLFPGDAQYGNWKAWLDQDDAGQLLSQVSFYKVAHHGSENATPKDALERMTTGNFAAMVSTQQTPWPSIPDVKLMDALDRKAVRRVVRSDSLPLPNAPSGPVMPKLPAGFEQGAFWYDYLIPLG